MAIDPVYAKSPFRLTPARFTSDLPPESRCSVSQNPLLPWPQRSAILALANVFALVWVFARVQPPLDDRGRMKRCTLLAAILLVGSAAGAHAQTTSFGVRGGLSLPVGDTRHEIGSGHHVGLSFVHPLDRRRNDIGLDVTYEVLGEKTVATQIFGFPIALREKAVILEAALCFLGRLVPKGAAVTPFIKWGVGLDDVTPDVTLITPSSAVHTSESHVWASVLGGVGVSTRTDATAGLCIEGLFHQIESDNKSIDFVTVALTCWRGSGR